MKVTTIHPGYALIAGIALALGACIIIDEKPKSSPRLAEAAGPEDDASDTVQPSPVREAEQEVESSKRMAEVPPLEITRVLRGPWRPYDDPAGIGAEILLNREPMTREEVLSVVREIVIDELDVVSVTVWASEDAFAEEKAGTYGPAWRRGLIAVVQRNRTHRGRAFFGVSRIAWLQEVGDLSYLFGTAEKF